MRTAIVLALTAMLFGMPRTTAAGQANTGCDRECLRGFLTRYLDALAAHSPGELPASPKVRFTEDTEEIKLGEGLWKTAGKRTPYRLDIVDVRQGVAGTQTIIEENGAKIMLLVRLKVEGRQITEVETQVTRSAADGAIFEPDAIKTPSQAVTMTPERAKLNSRADAIRIAEGYPAGLKAGSFVKADTQFAPEAYRFENGRMMASPTCTSSPGCNNIKTQKIPPLPAITHRVAAVDEEQGLVWIRMGFGPNSLFGANANKSLIVWEVFKVYGNQIHAVEAFMRVMPQNKPSGWDSK